MNEGRKPAFYIINLQSTFSQPKVIWAQLQHNTNSQSTSYWPPSCLNVTQTLCFLIESLGSSQLKTMQCFYGCPQSRANPMQSQTSRDQCRKRLITSFSVWWMNLNRARIHQSFVEQCGAPIALSPTLKVVSSMQCYEQPTSLHTDEVANELVSTSGVAQPITNDPETPVCLTDPEFRFNAKPNATEPNMVATCQAPVSAGQDPLTI